jgi:hypothetical protein
MDTDPVPCPDCGGLGYTTTHVYGEHPAGGRFGEWRREDCPICAGHGTVARSLADLRLAIIAEGERRRADRKARGLSLREEAARLKMTPQALSDIENGRRP